MKFRNMAFPRILQAKRGLRSEMAAEMRSAPPTPVSVPIVPNREMYGRVRANPQMAKSSRTLSDEYPVYNIIER